MECIPRYHGVVTAEQLRGLDLGDVRFELIRGRVVREPLPGVRHAAIVSRLAVRLGVHVENADCGYLLTGDPGFLLVRDPDTVRGPDLAYVSRERVGGFMQHEGFCDGAPDLAVEVLPPGNRPSQIEQQVRDYLDAGAQAVWIVDPRRRSVTVHQSGGTTFVGLGETLICDGLLPGFRLTISEIFDDQS